jgi:protease IV
MKSFFKYTLATIVGLLIWSVLSFFIMVGIISAISASSDAGVSTKPNTVLLLKLDQPIVDRASNSPFENFNPMSFQSEGQIGLNELLTAINKAKTDDNIVGIYMDLTYIPAGISTVDEIRQALMAFKESGKFLYAYSEYMGQKTYYLASVADKIYMNPVGTMELKGLSARYTFLKGALEKLGVEPVIFRHGKFKSAIEPFMLDKMSEANKLQTQTYVQSIWDYMVKNIAQAPRPYPRKG